MELRNNGGTTHFMHTIKSGRVMVVCNTNSLGKPVIKSKILKDVYENEDANGPQRLSSDMLFNHEQAKHGNPCFPRADRTLWGTKRKSDGEFSPTDHNPDSGLDDDTTLKQLKKRLFTKKRKCIPKQEGKQALEDESDLHEPLINLKQKRSKTSKSKRRRMNISAVSSSSTVDFVTKIDENLISEGSPQIICDKVDKGLYPGGTSTNEIKNIVLCGYREPMLCAQEYQNCSNNPNTILYNHVEDSEPISMLGPLDGTSVGLEPLEMECGKFIDLPPSSIQMKNEITDAHSSSSLTIENISSPGIQVSDMNFDGIDGGSGLPKDFNSVLLQDKSEADFLTDVEDSLSSPEKHCGSYMNSIILSKIEENVVSTVYSIANDMEFSSVPLEDKSEADLPCELEDSPSSPEKHCGSYLDSIILSKIEENVVSTVYTIANDMEFSSVPLEDKSEADLPYELQDSPSCPDKNCGSYQDSIIFSKIEENVVSTQDMEFSSFQVKNKTDADFPNELENSLTSPEKNFGSCQNSTISLKIEDNVVSTEDTIAHGMEFSSVTLEDKTEADFTNELEDSLSSPDKNLGSYPDSIIFLKIDSNVVSTEDTIADEDQPATCSNVIRRNGLNCEGHSEAELLKAKEKQTKALPTTDGESQSSLENQTHDVANTTSTLETYLSPENLLSARKAISPSSQEQLCLEMNSVEIWSDADQNKCEENLFEKQTTDKASSLRSELQHDNVTGNHKCPNKVRQRKIIISPRHNHSIKKSRMTKGNIEAPRFSRALHNLSTDCTSIQSCSERAIEFSKQQMHDMESLSLKLMNELKSMKDIVEQKLLFEAYRNVSLKNDADEVKSAIDSASKVEETSRKWLSIMSRDCNRFCKIMKMTPNTPAASSDTTPPRERRKIVFADEAGGDLCHVKFFQDDDTIGSPTNRA